MDFACGTEYTVPGCTHKSDLSQCGRQRTLAHWVQAPVACCLPWLPSHLPNTTLFPTFAIVTCTPGRKNSHRPQTENRLPWTVPNIDPICLALALVQAMDPDPFPHRPFIVFPSLTVILDSLTCLLDGLSRSAPAIICSICSFRGVSTTQNALSLLPTERYLSWLAVSSAPGAGRIECTVSNIHCLLYTRQFSTMTMAHQPGFAILL